MWLWALMRRNITFESSFLYFSFIAKFQFLPPPSLLLSVLEEGHVVCTHDLV